jgi:predicted ABC-type ATPase
MSEDPDWNSQDTIMLLTLDNLAKRYKCLPSEALVRADTLDLYVMTVANKWQRHQQAQASGQNPGFSKETKLSQQQLLAMMKTAKEMNEQRIREL